MLKRAMRPFPQLLIAMVCFASNTILDGFVMIKMLSFLDYALVGDMETLYKEIPLFMSLALLLVPLGLLSTVTKSWFRKDANLSMKRYYIRGVFQKNISEFQQENTATYISRLTNDVNTLDSNFVDGLFTVFSGITNFGVSIWILSTAGSDMIFFALIVTGICAVISMLLSMPVSKKVKERSDMFDGYTSYIKEVLSAFHIVKSNDLSDKVTKDYREKSESIQNKGYQIDRAFTFVNTIETGMFSLCIYLSLAYLAYLAITGDITAAGALTVSMGMQRLAWPLMMTIEALPKLFASRKLALKISDSLKNRNNYEETISWNQFKDSIELKNVCFHYSDEKDAGKTLYDVNMKLKRNGKYLIIGPSGGGKSTLLKLLRKYFDATEGEILLDGYPLKDIKKEDYFSRISNVEQQVFIFEDTLKNNITLYKDYSEDEITNAINAAGLSDFVHNLPDGLDTMIYDNGKNISGGERSRVVIARALLAKASILFMDEAFAALDMDRAREIERTILSLKNITVINVSHVIFHESKDQYDAIFRVKGTVKELCSSLPSD